MRDEEQPFGELRERVLGGTLNVVAIVTPLLGLVIIAGRASKGSVDDVTLVLSAYTLCFPVLWLLRRRLGFRSLAIALLGHLALTAFFVESRGGIAVGPTSINLLVIVLGAVFFGRRGAGVALLLISVLFAIAGVLSVRGWGPPHDASMWDTSQPAVWVRSLFALVGLAGAMAVAIVYVVEHLEREARELRLAVGKELEQRQARVQAEAEKDRERTVREEAQLAVIEARRVEALARLAGGIAHDFNNSLTVVMGATELALIEAGNRERVEARLGEIKAAAKAAAELTRQLLALGRNVAEQPKNLSLRAVVRQRTTSFQRVLPDDVVIEVQSQGEANAFVDEGQLERSLLNLVLNARDALPSGGKITLSTGGRRVLPGHAILAPGNYVFLSVRDDGLGMDEATLARVFEPFFTTKGENVGSGLGLVTVMSFARGAGGDVEVRSEPGHGATFTLLLPEADPGVKRAASTPSMKAVTGAGNGERILVAEDRDDVRAMMVRALEHAGFHVEEAHDGDAAHAALERPGAEYDLLCIDAVMPGRSTAEVLAAARVRHPKLRVLLCSGYVAEELLRRGVATGDLALLSKPFSGDHLVRRVLEELADGTPAG